MSGDKVQEKTDGQDARGRLIDFNMPPWPFWLAVGLVAVTFGNHIVWMINVGWANEYYGHGFLVPFIAAYLLYRRRHELRDLPRTGYFFGLPLLLAGLGIHGVAVYLDVNFPQGFGLVLVLAGLTTWLYGLPTLRVAAFPLSFLLFMVPMGRVLVDKFAQPMQLFSAQMAGNAALLMGMPVRIQGTTIDVPGYTFEVAIACSGLKSAIAMTALGALYAYVLVGPIWKRVAIFLFSFPAAVLANGVRIWLTVILGRAIGPAVAEGFFHTASGVFVFVIALLALFTMGSLIGCKTIREDV